MPKEGKGMNSVKGVYSYKSNPMKGAKQTSNAIGPNSNADSMKAQRLLQKAHSQQDSLRGKSGL
jgi:hypothetical protein|tara:strand:+ start:500 stop:691 length:192 start_codon:yes stop_codon:yes gene_type:complete